jgi:catechol 2,3-dioxygenase-like lactoylglutathione lyase family enzyme
MIDHVSVPVADLERSRAFYAAALAPLGYRVLLEPHPRAVGLGADRPDLWLALLEPGAPSPARVHVALGVETTALVDAFHTAALAAGGADNGGPGPRPIYHPRYYGAFVLDPDGHNVEAVCHHA